MNKNKGFTLIELLVVIAIIGILSSVVLASLNTARAKGVDAAVKSNLANARAQAELFYDSNANSYVVTADGVTDVCHSTALVSGVKGINPNVLAAITATGNTTVVVAEATAETTTTAVCYSASGTWVAQSPLKTAGFWCVDSEGTAKYEPSVLVASSTKCV